MTSVLTQKKIRDQMLLVQLLSISMLSTNISLYSDYKSL